MKMFKVPLVGLEMMGTVPMNLVGLWFVSDARGHFIV